MRNKKKSKPGKYFDPHYWEGCFTFKCKKGQCDYFTECFAAQKEDQKETENFIKNINQKLSDKIKLSDLSPLEKVMINHAIEKHGVEFDRKLGKYYVDKEALKKRVGCGANLYR